MKINKTFLKYLESQMGTQRMVAKKLGVSVTSISFYKRGLFLPSPKTALKIERRTDGVIPAKSWGKRV